MRSRETVLRLQRFRTEEKRRQVQDIEAMVADFTRKYDDLDALVKAEEAKNGVTDPAHFNYSMSAKSARVRRDNLLRSISELKDQHTDALTAFQEQDAELKKLELLAEKEQTHSGVSAQPHGGLAGAHVR
jgi:flagellar export protein FliJ